MNAPLVRKSRWKWRTKGSKQDATATDNVPTIIETWSNLLPSNWTTYSTKCPSCWAGNPLRFHALFVDLAFQSAEFMNSLLVWIHLAFMSVLFYLSRSFKKLRKSLEYAVMTKEQQSQLKDHGFPPRLRASFTRVLMPALLVWHYAQRHFSQRKLVYVMLLLLW